MNLKAKKYAYVWAEGVNVKVRLGDDKKVLIHEMMKAPNKKSTEAARLNFEAIFNDKYEKSVLCLNKDWKKLTTFFDFPAKHLTILKAQVFLFNQF